MLFLIAARVGQALSMSRPRAECWKADDEATLEVPIGEVQFNGWSPEPTIGEVYAATENGVAPWTLDMCAREPTAKEADCVNLQ